MNVIEYVLKRKKELDDFAQDWLENQEKEPEDWPETMDQADWQEQEESFYEMQREEQ